MPNYGAYRFTRIAGATPDAPDVYSPLQAGWVSPPARPKHGSFRSGRRSRQTRGSAYAKAASYGEQIRAELADEQARPAGARRANSRPSLSIRCFSSPNAVWPGMTPAARPSSSSLGVQSPYEAAESVAYLLGEARFAVQAGAHRRAVCLYGRRLRRTRSHAVSALRRAGGDVLSGPSGSARPRSLSAVPGRNQAARLQDAHADRS